MKNLIIDNVLAKMRESLSSSQLALLKNTLNTELKDSYLSISFEQKGNTIRSNLEMLDRFIAAKRIEGCSEKTIKYYRSTLISWLRKSSKPVDEISTHDVRQHLSEIQAHGSVSRTTVDNVRRIFSSFFSWLEDENYILKSPVRRIRKIRTETTVKETLNDEQIEILRNACAETRDKAMIDFLLSTGVRVGELANINISDIDFNERQCIVLGKGNKERTVYFSSRAKVNLLDYLSTRTDSEDALFVSLSKPNKRLTISGIEARCRELAKVAHVGRIHPHKFRRTLATMAIDKGMPIEQVQCLLGHCKIDTTLHYAMVSQNNVKTAHRKFLG